METIQISEKKIGDYKVFYVDDAMEESEVREFHKIVSKLSYVEAERSHEEDEYLSFRVDFNTEQLSNRLKVCKLSDELLENIFPDSRFELYRAYINMTNYGDVEYPHTDCEIHEKDITVLYYAHSIWKKEWGGETLFYDKDDSALAVAPRSGRFVVFPGAIEHVGTVPSRVCTVPRFSVALKYKKV